jgi:DNA (cytosine-5)-methyltransferase 1
MALHSCAFIARCVQGDPRFGPFLSNDAAIRRASFRDATIDRGLVPRRPASGADRISGISPGRPSQYSLQLHRTPRLSAMHRKRSATHADLPSTFTASDLMASKRRSPQCVNSFFAGIGGFDLAFERQGFKTSFFCEVDDFCRDVLADHWPNVPIGGDVAKLEPSTIPDARVWTAGFPCQDLSLAKVPHGRTGFRGEKSSMFFAFHNLLRVRLPEVVLLENVVGLLSSHGGADFQRLIASLTELGYGVAWRVLNARYFGVAQSRPRVFVCAWLGRPDHAVASLYEENASTVQLNERSGFITPTHCDVSGATVPLTSYCISATSGRHTGLDWARSYVSYENSVRRLTPLECERLQGFPDNWTKIGPAQVTPIDGNDTERYKAVGNAVAVPVVEWLAARIHKRLQPPQKLTGSSTKRPRSASARICALAPEFASPVARQHHLRREAVGEWQRGGWASGDIVVHAPASTAPIVPVESKFIDAVERGRVQSRYFLSANAAIGILRRVERRGRHLFAPLDASLRRLAAAGSDQSFRHVEKASKPRQKRAP